jgi:hypothetical protein
MSSPFFKMIGYSVPSEHWRNKRSGKRFDLKTEDFSGVIPVISFVASKGNGTG